MLVDDKLAKEKLARILVLCFPDLARNEDVHQLIRNTDLTDCQQTEEKAKSDE